MKCKTEGCENGSTSNVGRYSYCPDCREKRSSLKPPTPVDGRSLTDRVKELHAAAREADRLKARAQKITKDALKAKAEADAAAGKVAEIAREFT